MTRDELLETLTALRDGRPRDPEGDHIRADEALLAYINEDTVRELYDGIRKWYV